MKRVVLLIGIAVLLAACSQQTTPVTETPQAELTAQAGSWQKLGGALDFTVSKNAAAPKLVLDRSGNLVAAWMENNNGWRVYLERWNGTSWQSFGGNFPVSSPNPSFSIAFDKSNSPVVSTSTNVNSGVVVYRRDAASSWKALGSAYPGSYISADKNGDIYRIFHDKLLSEQGSPRGKNLIQRWNGNSWQTFYTFEKTVQASGGQIFDIPLTSLIFKSDGKPAVYWTRPDNSFQETISVWNGTAWNDACSVFNTYPRYGFVTLDKKDQCLGFNSFAGDELYTSYFQGEKIISATGIGGTVSTVTVDNLNRLLTVVSQQGSSNVERNLAVKRWTGSAWEQLDGILDRVASRDAFVDSYKGSLITDSKNMLYAVWLECIETDTSTGLCKNSNVYINKYVP